MQRQGDLCELALAQGKNEKQRGERDKRKFVLLRAFNQSAGVPEHNYQACVLVSPYLRLVDSEQTRARVKPAMW
jgi:hypothetical protein